MLQKAEGLMKHWGLDQEFREGGSVGKEAKIRVSLNFRALNPRVRENSG